MESLAGLGFAGKNIRLERRGDRVWVSLTDMAKATGKELNDYTRLSDTAKYLAKLESIGGMPIIESRVGGTPESTGTWAIEEVAVKFNEWLSRSESKVTSQVFECSIRDCLAEKLNGETEVPCRAGVVDIVTNSEVIEVKKVKHWKAAVGQALVYACEFKGLKPRIHLFGKVSRGYEAMILSFCTELEVSVSFEEDYYLDLI